MPSNLIQLTSKVTSLSKAGRITCARKLFDEMPHRDSISWNAMLTGYSHLGLHREALSFFYRMRTANVKPDHFSFTAALNACAGMRNLRYGLKMHALVLVHGCRFLLPVKNSLIDMYGKCLDPCSASKVFGDNGCGKNVVTWCSMLFAYVTSGLFSSAREVFCLMPKKVVIAWNIMISGHARQGDIKLCLRLLREMQESLCSPDQFTFSALMNACTESSEFWYGCVVHALISKTGWNVAAEAKNSVISFYANFGYQHDVVKEFESVGMLTQVSWNAIIDAHMRMGHSSEALKAFNQSPEKNVVSWTSMISGYTRKGDGEEALRFFVDMMKNCVNPDDFTFGAALHACSSLAVLRHGNMVHCSVINHGYHAYAYVGNGLVNMYAKCGDINDSVRAFSDISEKDIVSWNTMLFGFGMHGLASEAIEIYENMTKSMVKPDNVTFIGLLMSCSHSGLIEKGRALFDSMGNYGLPHEVDHVACMVDMLGRGGHIAEAIDIAKKHSRWHNAETSSLEAVLGACSAHNDMNIGRDFGETLKILEPEKEMSYVLLSNFYCASGQWKEAEIVRKTMLDRGVKKMPGCSWIEVRNSLFLFVAGDTSHPLLEELSKLLFHLEAQLRNPCFTAVDG